MVKDGVLTVDPLYLLLFIAMSVLTLFRTLTHLTLVWVGLDQFLFFFFWPLCCLSFDWRILITSLVSSNSYYIHKILFIYIFWLHLWYFFCPSSIYIFWLHLWYLFCNQNTSIEGQTTQWPKEKEQKLIYKALHIKPGVNLGAPDG
jgi:hypothetical protein